MQFTRTSFEDDNVDRIEWDTQPMQANQTDIQKILGGVQQYVIPLFQRPYSWDTRQWTLLWDDLFELCEEDKPRNHFIGSIVTMPARSVPEGVSKYILIDGQQRLTTLLILLAAMRDKARKQSDKIAEKIDDLLLKNRHHDDLDIYKLLPTQSDRSAFCAFMDGQPKTDNGQLTKAFHFFEKKLRLRESLDLEKLYTVIGKHLVLVSIVLDRDDNPYLIFESLNAKGRPLTQADLIRNFFFMRIHLNKQEEVFEKYWKPMQDDLGENLTEYIRHFLMRDGHIIRKGDVYFTLKEAVAGREDQDDVAYLSELSTFAAYYSRLLDPSREPHPELAARFLRLNRIEATTAYPFLLNTYRDLDEEKLPAADFAHILDVLESFLIRRFVCNVPSNALTKIFISLYGQASKYPSLLEGTRAVLRTRDFPGDKLFRDRLATFRLYAGGDRLPKARLILEQLEESFEHKEKIDFSLQKIEIEHVMPQTLTDGWKQGLGENWEMIHSTWLHTLGNLTLTGYNPSLSNADYASKKAILANSHLELNRYFATQEVWDEASILRRGEALAARAAQIWRYSGSDDQAVEMEFPDEDEDQEDATLLKGRVLELLGGAVERVGKHRYQTFRVADGTVVNIKYSRAHKDYYWFGIHSSLWEDLLKSGATHLALVLGQIGFVTVPIGIMREYLVEANVSPKSDGTVRHFHVQVSREPNLELFHYGKPRRHPLRQFFTAFAE